ncbi:MAG: hypothetical protein GY827_04910 [Cytophagales bacterium]|nr:hypothetical protein [Cytophagales bacterium]
MFDSHHNHITEIREVTKNINVTEKKAPTDESIKLLDEFKEKAEDRIIKSFNIQDNNINGAILVLAATSASFDSMSKHIVHYRYTMNGHTYQGKGEVDKILFQRNKMECLKLLIDNMAQNIATGLFEANKENLKNMFI